MLTVNYRNKLSLKKQSLNGALWTLIDIIVNKGSYFIATIILARILGPREFGIIGMITLFVTIGNVIVDSGMSTSLLRTNKITETDYSTVFIINIVTSLIVYCLLFFTAPLIASFYKQLILIDVIRIYGLGILINSFRSIHNVKLTKDLQFKILTILNLPGNIISLIVAIYLGHLGFGVWSLVYLFIVNQIISTFIFWLAIKWRPSLEFDYSKLNLTNPAFFIGGLPQMGGDILATSIIQKINSIQNLKHHLVFALKQYFCYSLQNVLFLLIFYLNIQKERCDYYF